LGDEGVSKKMTIRSKIRPYLHCVVHGIIYGTLLVCVGFMLVICLIPCSPVLILYAFCLWLEEKPVWQGLVDAVLTVLKESDVRRRVF